MAKAVFASISTATLLGLVGGGVGTALASDRELRATLDRLACVPDRVVSTKLSPTLVVYEVVCKQTGRAVQVECLKTECRFLTAPRDNEER